MGVKHGKSKKLTIIKLLKPFVKKYKYRDLPDTSNTIKKIGENYGLWRSKPGISGVFPTMKERVTKLLFGENSFDQTDLESIEFMIDNMNDEEENKPMYELNQYIIQYHVNNPEATKDNIITDVQSRREREKNANNDSKMKAKNDL